MSLTIPYRSRQFSTGYNDYDGVEAETGLRFRILSMKAGGEETISSRVYETAVLVIKGKGTIIYNDRECSFERSNWIDRNPVVVHFPAGDVVTVRTGQESRIAVVSTLNSNQFKGKIYTPAEIDVEHRGKDILDGTCYRLVRLAFDRSIAPEPARIVLGEVLNFPGKWSSYPPHHHEQSEIYYYEFSPVEGYGHGELGDGVFKIQHQDLLAITDSRDHSQVAAPGYHMYYIWAIRHMKDNPYKGFEFTKPHDKLLS